MQTSVQSLHAPQIACAPMRMVLYSVPRGRGGLFTQRPDRRRRGAQTALCSSQAAELLTAGREKHNRGDRMGAVMMYERALKKDPTPTQRQEALYNSTCAHAFAGDVEFAQVTLRDAVAAGLDFEAAMQNPDMVNLQASQQVIIQLRKFAAKIQRGKGQKQDEDAVEGSRSATARAGPAQRMSFGTDVSDLLGTEMKGLDTSVAGVVKRVGILLLVLTALGFILFFVGFKYAFPEL